MQRHPLPRRQPQRPKSANRRKPKRHQPNQRPNLRLHRTRRAILHAQHPSQCRTKRAQPPQRNQRPLLQPDPQSNRLHGRRQPHRPNHNNQPRQRRSPLRLHRHRPRSLRQHQRPTRHNLLRNNLLPALPNLRLHPPKPRLPRSHLRSHPTHNLPLALLHSRSRRRQRADLPTRHRRHPPRLLRLRRLPRRLQQSHFRFRREFGVRWGKRRDEGVRIL